MANIGVDIDDVLSETVRTFLDFYNPKHGTHFVFENIYDYSFGRQFGLTPDQEIANIKHFFASEQFANLPPVPGSQTAIAALAEQNRLIAVTSRPEQLKDVTEAWLTRHFADSFEAVILTNGHFDKSKSKADVCRNQGLDVFIEDQLVFAEDCSTVCRQVFLFDKPWNAKPVINENIIRISSWNQILKLL